MKALSLALLVLAALPGLASAQTVYTLDNAAPPLLASFDTATPQNLTVIGPVTGLLGAPGSELVTAIDFRPADGRLYAISNLNRLYTINTTTAAATVVGDTAFTPAIPGGASTGADFDPVRDVLRVVTDGIGGPRVNLRISPTTGQSTVDTPTNKAPGDNTIQSNPCVCAVAYTNNFAGALSTTLYGLGPCGSVLVRIGSENGDPLSADSGFLTLVEETNPYVNVNQSLRLGLDIAPSGDAYALVQQGGSVYLFQVDLRPGAQTLLNPIALGGQPTGPGTEWRDIAIAPAANDFSFSAAAYTVSETAGGVTASVTRAGPALGTASVGYATSDGSATSPLDYTPTAGTLSFAAGQQTATFSVPIVDDALLEGPEALVLSLSAPAGGAASLAAPASSTLTIESDELAPPAPGAKPPDKTAPTLDKTAPTLVLSRQSSRSLARFLKGVSVKATPGEPAALKFELIARKRGALLAASRDIVLASRKQPLAGGARTVTLKPSRRLVGNPRKAFTVRLRVTATDAAGNRRAVTKSFSVKPNPQR